MAPSPGDTAAVAAPTGAGWRHGVGLISVRSVIRLAGERWGKKWGKNMLHLGHFVSFDTTEDARDTALVLHLAVSD